MSDGVMNIAHPVPVCYRKNKAASFFGTGPGGSAASALYLVYVVGRSIRERI